MGEGLADCFYNLCACFASGNSICLPQVVEYFPLIMSWKLDRVIQWESFEKHMEEIVEDTYFTLVWCMRKNTCDVNIPAYLCVAIVVYPSLYTLVIGSGVYCPKICVYHLLFWPTCTSSSLLCVFKGGGCLHLYGVSFWCYLRWLCCFLVFLLLTCYSCLALLVMHSNCFSWFLRCKNLCTSGLQALSELAHVKLPS